MCDYCFPYVFLLGDTIVFKFERCEHRNETSIVGGDQEGVKCQLSFVLKDQVKKVSFCGGDMELYGCCSCM